MEMDMADNNDNSGEGNLPLNVIRGENEENEENGSNAHTSSDNSEKPNTADKVRDNENVIISKGEEDTGGMNKIRVNEKEPEQTACPHSRSASVSLPPLFHLEGVPQRITPDLLLAALREEPGVPDPDTIHKDCYDAMNALKEEGVLNKYVLSEDEAAVLCAIPMLVQLKSGPFSMQKMVESCKAGTPSKLFVIMLTTLRKLPRFKGIMYIESEVQSEEEFKIRERMEHDIIQDPIYVATKGLSSASGTTDIASPREVFRVEEGWGYDISDFAPERDESGRYVTPYGGDIVIIEPWQGFEVVNSGIYRPQERISIVPVKKVGSELVYCTEIVPNVSSHAVRIMKEGMDDVNVVRNMLDILTTHPFDTPYDSRTTFRKDGGIECLIDCYNKHNAFGKEVIVCLENAIGEESSAHILLDKGFIKTVADLTFENIDDPVLCQSSSAIIKTTCSSFAFAHDFDKLFQDIRGFKLILDLLRVHKTNATICLNVLIVLNSMFLYSGVMQIPEDTLKSLFDSGLFEILDYIMEKCNDESILIKCDNIFSSMCDNGLKKFVDFDIGEHIDSAYRQNKITNNTINQLDTNDERLEELSKKLSVNSEAITVDDIKAALQGIGISDPKKILDESKEVYATNKDELNKSYTLSEDEIIVIASYTYEGKGNSDMSPYSIINKKLWDNNAQDQKDDEKSYLRLLLRALRKLPREKPQTLYRGISDDKDKREYVKDDEVEWNGFSSTTTTMKEAESFLTDKETNQFSGTLFEVRNVWGYSIRELSIYIKEDEVLLEPMMKFVVKDVKKEGSLTRVVLEPKEDQSLLFMESIPPTCVQRIILNLKNLKSSTDPKEICRLCDILRKVPMDDDTSPDSRRMFREHGGTKLLCDLFKEHRKFSIARALAHVMDPRDVVSNIKFVKNISEDIYANPTEETIDIEASLVFLDFLGSLNAKNVQTSTTMKMIKGFSTLVNKFVDDKSFCLKVLKTLSSNFFDVSDRVIMTKKVIKTHLSDPEICKVGCLIMKDFLPKIYTHLEQADEEDCIKIVAEVMKIHIGDACVCMHACGAFLNAVRENENNQNMAREVGCIGFVLDIISKHIDNVDVCIYGCGALLNMAEHNCVNQEEARRLNGIKIVMDATNKHSYDANACVSGCGALSEMIDNYVIQDNQIRVTLIKTVLNSMNTHISNEEICKSVCNILWNISEANSVIQRIACENGCIDVLLKALEAHDNNKVVCERCCGALGVILSSQDLHSKYFTDDVRSIIEGCHEKHKDSTEVFQFLMGLIRKGDSKVREAIERGACTKEAFPKCSDDCKSKGTYCPTCCVQQRAFRCRTCDKDKILLYCETCWRRDHKGHECEEFFYPVRCATKTKTN